VRIVHRLPYYVEQTTLAVRGEVLRVRPFQIIVWVSIGLREMPDWDARTPHLPAILDPGNNHNLSISQNQLVRWAGIRPELLRPLGVVRERGMHVPLHAARAWLHRNVPGTREIDRRQPHPLVLERGIAVYPEGEASAPRLPLLGLRALTNTGLYTAIDGARQEVSIRTARPWW
jgi:hypothetical protein